MSLIYLNNPPNPFGEHTHAIALNRWLAEPAPRLLPGSVTWTGTGHFKDGDYYAAGPRETFGESWDNLDAWPVEAITNLEIVELITKRAKERGFKGIIDCFDREWF